MDTKFHMGIKDHSKDYKIEPSSCGKHCELFPKNIFCIIAGSTGCGKTNLLIDLLKSSDKLNYSDVYVYATTLYQPAYVHLKEYYENMEKMINYQTNRAVKIGHFLDPDEEIVDPGTLDKNKNHIMIFDDVLHKDQKQIKDYFCRGRHNNVNVFYLVQSLHAIAKHCIRQNANIFILFHQDTKTLKYFHETHCDGDMDFKEFKTFCDYAWFKEHGFIVINLWDKPYCGRYWANYTHVYIPDKYSR